TQWLERVFNICSAIGEVAVTKMMDVHSDVRASAQQRYGSRVRFALPYSISGKYFPHESQLRMPLAQLNQRTATSDLDVVAVRAQTKDRAVRGQIEFKSQN